MLGKYKNRLFRGLFIGSVLLAAGCGDDDPVAPENHYEPEQVQLRAGSVVVANATKSQAFHSAIVAIGVKAAVEVVFLDDLGNPISDASDQFLEVSIANTSIAAWSSDPPGSFIGRIEGLSAGMTTAEFRLMHGTMGSSNAHADVIPAAITIAIVLPEE